MNENLNVRLGNPSCWFSCSFGMFLFGIVVGVYQHPSRTHSIAIAFVAGALTILHELVCCFVWCSISAWWIGRRSAELKKIALTMRVKSR